MEEDVFKQDGDELITLLKRIRTNDTQRAADRKRIS
jgi:hypothetical protein